MSLFSPREANALIAKIAPLVEELLRLRRELAIHLLASDPSLGVRPPRSRLAGPRSTLPTPRFGEMKSEIIRMIHRIESHGCVVKDIDLGLVDFPSQIDGEPVLLCWKLGELSVGFWHRDGEGFEQRRAIL
ncbi:MAG TPA: DUF2203 domain-containing protein, partial [Candidatus Dormibacteraeota bacterium]|nr:DUF2203 domain-containing protein [Candidatus Dormibacteraeota bacterium]